MKAIVYHDYGSPDNLELQEAACLASGIDERVAHALVSITSVNRGAY